jgi:predicted ATP-grasp superfamily ATP-dependent carboligase
MASFSRTNDTLRTLGIVLLSLIVLPLTLAVVYLTYLAHFIARFHQPRHPRLAHGQPRRTVLVTGVGMTKGLTISRAFYLCGHRVIGADFEQHGIPCPGRFSKSLSAFHTLPKPSTTGKDENTYTRRLLDIIASENVDLWVSCSGVATAAEDAQAKEAIEEATACRCIQFDEATTMKLHEKDAFTRETSRLGLPVPETHDITSHKGALEILHRNALGEKGGKETKKYIMKPVGMNDAHRGDMTLLPLTTWPETEQHVNKLPVSEESPWILQQFIAGGQEYCTHALIVRGTVRVFVSCPSSELLMHYRALTPSDALHREMLEFTRQFVERSEESGAMTGHLSFDFMVDDQRRIYAIECNPRAHTAVVLFAQEGQTMAHMVDAYLSVLDEPAKVDDTGHLVTPAYPVSPRYWIAHDLVTLGVLPLVHGGMEAWKGVCDLLGHVTTWKEGSFETWDPWPTLVLYHVYWPLTILDAWWHGQRWSRVNVSTTKMFML